MGLRRWLTLVLVSAMLTLSPLAYSDLPDQLWLGGFFDGGDEDDALFFVQLQLNAVEPLAVYAPPPVKIVQILPQPHERVAPVRALPSTQTRAPPLPQVL